MEDMRKTAIWAVAIVLYALTAFFGLGPVLLADGQPGERMLTLALVLIVFAVITALLRLALRRL